MAGLDEEPTRIQRPNLAAAGVAAASQIDLRQLGSLSAANELIAAANPLLMTISSLRACGAPASVDGLRSRLLDLFADFEAACRRASIPEEHETLARFALCTVLDEAVQRTAWGHAAQWPQRSLSIKLFGANHGGDAFFNALDRLVQAPSKYLQVLQLFYVCLALGFMGKYLVRDASGRAEVAEIRERLYQQYIRAGAGNTDGTLSPNWKGVTIGARKFQGFAALWIVAAAVVIFCLLLYSAYLLKLGSLRDEVGIGQLALKPAVVRTEPKAPPPKPRLTQLLAAEIAAQQVRVDESATESVVTLISEQPFESGSATPSTATVTLIERVAAALDNIDGRVIVTGHTDNVPPRNLRFASNFELSKGRALTVADVIRSRLKQPARVADEGRGDSEPIAGNDTSEGRSKNRRVEITLRVDRVGQ